MANFLYTSTIPVFKQYLVSLDNILKTAQAHATLGKIDPDALLQARLFPDMFTFTRQVQLSTRWAREVAARLSGQPIPPYKMTERSFDELHALIASTIEYIESVDESKMDGTREVVLQPSAPSERKMTAEYHCMHVAMPQFFFHVTTAYAILRHNGVTIGKRDFLGKY